MMWLNLLKITVDLFFQSSIIMSIEKGDALKYCNFRRDYIMNDFEFVMMMINEACKSHSSSYHVLNVDDGYGRYLMRAEWLNGAPSLCIMYDDVSGRLEVYHEVLDVSDTQAIKDLLVIWQEIVESF